ncbi:MAG: 50S ribosomal protein L17 [Bacteroidales bacterium]|nr:50S ribosomal protein L17 [Bacteroidales bacterium]
MRHQKSINHLGRTSTHRAAMLSNMASSLIMHKRISTTIAKAKALRGYVEPLITRAKIDSTHSRRVVFSYLQDKEAVTELFRDISVKVADRPGGYVRILKTGFRLGDNADMCIIELVDYNENLLTAKDTTAKKAVRRRKPAAKKATDAAVDAPVAEKAPKAKAPKAVAEAVEVVEAEEVAETPAVEEAKEDEAEAK